MANMLTIPNTIMTLGEAVWWARNERKMTLRQLAQAVGLSAPFLSDIEHGRRWPKEIAPFAAALGVSELELGRLRLHDSAENWARENPALAKLLEELRPNRGCPCPWCHVLAKA